MAAAYVAVLQAAVAEVDEEGVSVLPGLEIADVMGCASVVSGLQGQGDLTLNSV